MRCAEFLNLPLFNKPDTDCYIEFNEEGPSLVFDQLKQTLRHRVDFNNATLIQRSKSQNQALIKAFKDKQTPIKRILDATAGWCRDSFILAQNGFNITSLEHSSSVYFLCNDALQKLFKSQQLDLKLIHQNSYQYLSQTNVTVDAIYLDPMFPEHSYKAKNKKELQVLQALTENHDIENLFHLSLQKARRRVVVKRAIKSPFLCELNPSFQFKEKTIRFDIYQC